VERPTERGWVVSDNPTLVPEPGFAVRKSTAGEKKRLDKKRRRYGSKRANGCILVQTGKDKMEIPGYEKHHGCHKPRHRPDFQRLFSGCHMDKRVKLRQQNMDILARRLPNNKHRTNCAVSKRSVHVKTKLSRTNPMTGRTKSTVDKSP